MMSFNCQVRQGFADLYKEITDFDR